MKRRALSIVLAVLLAILGTAGVLAYVKHANARALAGQRAVTVLVAKSLIPSGTSAGDARDKGLLVAETMPASSVPANAMASVTLDVSALVTDADVQPGQLLLRPMLVTSARATNGLAIPSGMVAVSVLFCLPEAVAGNLQPGAQVAVFDTVVTGNTGVTAAAACTGPHQWVSGDNATTTLVLPKVTVLSVGQASTTGQNGSQTTSSGSNVSNSVLVTLAVSQANAQRVIQLTADGLPYLALLGSSSSLSVTAASGH